MYCVVGQCDPNEDHAEISDKIDDYLWLKLSQLEFDADDSSQDALSFERFQKLLYEDYGKWFCVENFSSNVQERIP